jgi:hypothetical protein
MCLHAHHFFFKKNHAHTTFERLSNDHCTSFDCSTRRCRLTNRKPQRARFPPARSWGGLVVSIFDPLLSKKKKSILCVLLSVNAAAVGTAARLVFLHVQWHPALCAP